MTDLFGKRCCVIYYGCVFLLKVTFIQKRTCSPLIVSMLALDAPRGSGLVEAFAVERTSLIYAVLGRFILHPLLSVPVYDQVYISCRNQTLYRFNKVTFIPNKVTDCRYFPSSFRGHRDPWTFRSVLLLQYCRVATWWQQTTRNDIREGFF